MIEETENLAHEVDENGNQFWYKDGQCHRADGPAVILKNGTQVWWINGKYHREDGPAIIRPDGEQRWYKNGELHREDGPAFIRPDGEQRWYKNGKLHQEDGPALIHHDGLQRWWINGKLHREDGPAVIYPDGQQEWWINGKEVEWRVNKSFIFGWDVNIQVDSDGHLNIYITNKDKTDIVECDTGQGDGCDGEQLALRFSTNRIEDEYKESN